MNVPEINQRNIYNAIHSDSESASNISSGSCRESGSDVGAVGGNRLRGIGSTSQTVTSRINSTVQSFADRCRSTLSWGASSDVAEVDADEACRLLEASLVPTVLDRKLASVKRPDVQYWGNALLRLALGGAALGLVLPRLNNYSEAKPNVPSYIFNTVERQGYFMGTHDCGVGGAEHVLALDPDEKNYVLIERAFKADDMKTYVSTMAKIEDDLRWFQINQPEKCVEYRFYSIEDNLTKDFVDTLLVPLGMMLAMGLIYRTGQSMRDHYRQGPVIIDSFEMLRTDIEHLLKRSRAAVLQQFQRNGLSNDSEMIKALTGKVLATDSLQKGNRVHPTIRNLIGLDKAVLEQLFNGSIKEVAFSNRHALKLFLTERLQALRADVVYASLSLLVKTVAVKSQSMPSVEREGGGFGLRREKLAFAFNSESKGSYASASYSLSNSASSKSGRRIRIENLNALEKKKIKTRPDSQTLSGSERSSSEHEAPVVVPPASFELSEDGKTYTITFPDVKALSRADGAEIRLGAIRMPVDSNTRDVAFQEHCLKLFDRMVTILPSKSRGTPGLKRCKVQGRPEINYKLKFTQTLYARLRYIGVYNSDAEILDLIDTKHH